MNKSAAPVPADLIAHLPWHIRQTLHAKLRNHCRRIQIARWLSRQTAHTNLPGCRAAITRYCTSPAYRDWLEQDRRDAVVTGLLADGTAGPRGQRLALSLVMERLQTTAAISTAAGTDWSGL